VSGVPFNEYIQRNILDPLDMHHATFQELVPADLKADLMAASVYENGVYTPRPFEYVGGFRPAGSGSMSALDMTHFMIAHLQDGRYGSSRILDSATAEQMHARTFANDPRLPGMALGFYEQRMNGVRVIGHEGDTQYFHTAMFIVPGAQVGIFLS
jgi:CubicO group peptidase (beta-lactamase class C family)